MLGPKRRASTPTVQSTAPKSLCNHAHRLFSHSVNAGAFQSETGRRNGRKQEPMVTGTAHGTLSPWREAIGRLGGMYAVPRLDQAVTMMHFLPHWPEAASCSSTGSSSTRRPRGDARRALDLRASVSRGHHHRHAGCRHGGGGVRARTSWPGARRHPAGAGVWGRGDQRATPCARGGTRMRACDLDGVALSGGCPGARATARGSCGWMNGRPDPDAPGKTRCRRPSRSDGRAGAAMETAEDWLSEPAS